MGSQSDAVILLAIFAFEITIIFMMGLIGGAHVSAIDAPKNTLNNLNVLNFWDYVGIFFQGIFFSIGELGIFNIIFLPLAVVQIYLVLKLARGGG